MTINLSEKDQIISAQVALKAAVEITASDSEFAQGLTGPDQDGYRTLFTGLLDFLNDELHRLIQNPATGTNGAVSAVATAFPGTIAVPPTFPQEPPAPVYAPVPQAPQAPQAPAFQPVPVPAPATSADEAWQHLFAEAQREGVNLRTADTSSWFSNLKPPGKRNPKGPDFKAKNNGPKDDKGEPVALWLSGKNVPAWVKQAIQ